MWILTVKKTLLKLPICLVGEIQYGGTYIKNKWTVLSFQPIGLNIKCGS
uniref:SRCR domain-containing protein n=1 Tax=Anguilla anguilla TaxID=7936 RepID=A0A0E9SL32_ANGAN